MAIMKIKIDGRDFAADNSKTILQAARDNGIEIPTLCFDPRLPPYGSCLVCVVEVRNQKRLVMSCTTPVAEGMDIYTSSPAALTARKSALEMLLSNHWADCRGPCLINCPANVDVQGYLALANAGDYMGALELIRQTNPMPLICGRVCVRKCEANCRRAEVDSPVAINFMKRYVTDLEYDNLKVPALPPKNGKKVAVVGGGPAGLTCAYFLARKGYAVNILDKQPKLGGMLRYGIPEYRLPQKLLDKEIDLILAHGISVKTGMKLGENFTLDSLKAVGYDAIFLALGSWVAKGMGVEGENHKNILPGIKFLEGVKRDGAPVLKGVVAVVGGGNTAIDAARTALRCGADKVTVLYRRTRAEMPADDVEIEDAIAEGVEIQYLVAPKKAVVENDRLAGIECYRMELGEPDKSGRRRPVQIKDSEFVFKCDWAISAIGQDQDLSALANTTVGEIKQTKWKSIEADSTTMMTSVPGVFAGGDAMTGPAAAIDAIGAGRKAAWVIDRYIQTGVAQPFPAEFLSRRDILSPPDKSFFEGFEKSPRADMRKNDPKCSIGNFVECDLGVADEAVAKETSRCLVCGCRTVFNCDLKDYSTECGADQAHFKGKVKKYKVDDRHPFIVLDPNKCILCGRCVRYCGELIGVHALGFVNRGFETVVRPALDKPLAETSCITCGNCIEVCPTGALEFRPMQAKPGPFQLMAKESVCSFCGVGCRIEINEAGRERFIVNAKPVDAHTAGQLCVKGRFASNYLGDSNRISKPRIKGGVDSTDMTSAAKAIAKGLLTVSKKHGPDSLSFFVSPRIPLEQLALIKEIAGNIGCRFMMPVEDLLRKSEVPALKSALQESVEGSDLIVTIGTGVLTYNPVFFFKVRAAVRSGAKLVHIGMAAPEIKKIASVIANGKSTAAVLRAVCGSLVSSGKYDKELVNGIDGGTAFLKTHFEEADESNAGAVKVVAEALSDKSKKVVFVCNPDAMLGGDSSELKWANDLLLLSGRKDSLVIVRNDANRTGFVNLIGGVKGAGGIGELRTTLDKGKIKGLLVVGQDATTVESVKKALPGMEFVAAVDVFETGLTAGADVVVPLVPNQETDGTVVSFDGKVQKFKKVFEPLAGFGGTEFFNEVIAALGGKKMDNGALGKVISAKPEKDIPERFFNQAEGTTGAAPYRSATTYSMVWEPKIRVVR